MVSVSCGTTSASVSAIASNTGSRSRVSSSRSVIASSWRWLASRRSRASPRRSSSSSWRALESATAACAPTIWARRRSVASKAPRPSRISSRTPSDGVLVDERHDDHRLVDVVGARDLEAARVVRERRARSRPRVTRRRGRRGPGRSGPAAASRASRWRNAAPCCAARSLAASGRRGPTTKKRRPCQSMTDAISLATASATDARRASADSRRDSASMRSSCWLQRRASVTERPGSSRRVIGVEVAMLGAGQRAECAGARPGRSA